VTTTLDLSTDVFHFNSQLSGGGSIVPNGGLGAYNMDFALKLPHLEPGGTVTLHFTGTFNANNLTLDSLLSADMAGYSGSAYYTIHPLVGGGSAVFQTLDITIGTGVEQYDVAVAAGEQYMYVTAHGTSSTSTTPEITGISFDGTGDVPLSGGGPLSVDIPATILSSDDGVFAIYGASPLINPDTATYIPVTGHELDAPFGGYVRVRYGSGPKRLNWTQPDGIEVLTMEYIAKAYREADVAFDSPAPSGWIPDPAANPWLSLEAVDRSEKLAFPQMVVTTSWADAPDYLVVAEPNMVDVFNNDTPMDLLTAWNWSRESGAVVNCAYLAARITYQLIDSSGEADPVRRRFY
jgi:hypothetical protein